jgi:hypothetical protein
LCRFVFINSIPWSSEPFLGKSLYFSLREGMRGYPFFWFEVLHRKNDVTKVLPQNYLTFLRVALSFLRRRLV